MKIKYGNNENCRNTIREKPHEHIETWCLQNRKQTEVKERYSGKGFSIVWATSLALPPGLGVAKSGGRSEGNLDCCGGLKHREYLLLS